MMTYNLGNYQPSIVEDGTTSQLNMHKIYVYSCRFSLVHKCYIQTWLQTVV